MAALSPALRAQGRATYRTLLRSAAVAFHGDTRVLNGFRDKARTDFVAGRGITNEDEYRAQLSHATDVADFLRKNLIQGVNEGQDDIWKLQWREGIELGDNDTIKNALRQKAAGIPPKGSRRSRQAQSPCSSSSSQTQPQTVSDELMSLSSPLPLSSPNVFPLPSSSAPKPTSTPFKSVSKKNLIEARNSRSIPVLLEEDLEEKFVRGSGPGGQAINKTRSNVFLLHKPTGIRITCQDTRSLDQNRKIARKLMIEKLDQIQNPGLSKLDVKTLLEQRRKRNKKKKQLKKKRATEGEHEDDEVA